MTFRAFPAIGAVVAAAVAATTPIPSMAQDNAEARLRRAEAEIRALQRVVFPGGDGQFFEPQISARSGSPSPQSGTNAASTTAVTDILARLDAMEAQLQRLTAQSEEQTNAMSLLEARVETLEGGQSADGPFTASPTRPNPLPSNERVGTVSSDVLRPSDRSTEPQERPAGDETPTQPSADRVSGVQAIAKPQTDDPGDDEYSYGFRLWNAGYYPEARQQLSSFVEQYPNHSRTTYGRNLLGRAFLDDGMPEEAARWFLRNYQADRTARRAPDSLLFLAESMIAMEDTRRACIALSEFAETYPAVATGRLADQYQSNRARVTCE